MPLTRTPQTSPESKFREGSVGSKMETDNPVCSSSKVSTSDVMKGARGSETSEQHKGSRGSLLKETDHPFQSNAILDTRIHKDSPEMVRRQNSRSRDQRTGYKITDDTVYPSS